MNYSIVLYSFYSKGSEPDTDLTHVGGFVERCGISKFVSNMKNKWVWDVRGYDDYEADGPCVFIKF